MRAKNKAVLRQGENLSIDGYSGKVKKGQKFNFRYDKNDNFFIVINRKKYEEVSTAFDFVPA